MMICLAQRNNVAEGGRSFFVSPSTGVSVTYEGFAAVPPNNYESFIDFDRTVTMNYYLLGGNR